MALHLGAPLLAGSLEATHPADFGLSLLLKLFEYAARRPRPRQLHQLFLGSREMGSWGCMTQPAWGLSGLLGFQLAVTVWSTLLT